MGKQNDRIHASHSAARLHTASDQLVFTAMIILPEGTLWRQHSSGTDRWVDGSRVWGLQPKCRPVVLKPRSTMQLPEWNVEGRLASII